MPVEHYYGWLSQEFGGALPEEIWRAQQRLPVGFLERLIEYRRYAEAYRANLFDEKGWDSTPLRRLAKEIEHERAAEAATND